MSILFVLLTFFLVLTIMYFQPGTPAVALQPTSFQKVTVPKMLCTADVQVPQEYSFHPGYTSVHDEGHHNTLVGIDDSPVIYSARSTGSRSPNSTGGFAKDRSSA